MARLFRTPLLLLTTLTGAFSLPALAASPADTVTAFHTVLEQSMADSAKLHCEGRMQRVQPAVEATFDLPFITERTLRRHWKTLQPEQQQAFTAALRLSVITTYATEFAAPGAVRFTTGASEALANGDALVHTTLTPRDGDAVALDYVLKPRGAGWQVVNVLAEGVSDLALRATQYDGLMKAEGFDALLAKLDSQTRQLKERCK